MLKIKTRTAFMKSALGLVLAALLLPLVLVMLAGCGGGDPEEEETVGCVATAAPAASTPAGWVSTPRDPPLCSAR